MRTSQYLLATLKETPRCRGGEPPAHARAGMIRKLARPIHLAARR